MNYKKHLSLIITICVLFIIVCISGNWRGTKYSEIELITYKNLSGESNNDEAIIDVRNKKVCVNYHGYQSTGTVRRELSDDEIDKILKACKDSQVLNWQKRYVKYFINDGHEWSVSIKIKGGTTKTTYFSNRTPRRYSRFDDVIYKIMYPDK